MASTMLRTMSDIERDSPSPYPPSTPSNDSDDENEHPMYLASFGLRAAVYALPEQRLRELVLRLSDTNHSFRRALQKEVAFVEEPDTPPTTPTRATPRRGKAKKGSKARKTRGNEGKQDHVQPTGKHQPLALKAESPPPPMEIDNHNECVYHPGHLEDEVYEFVSRTPNGAAFKVVQTVTMWSCCNEDEWSPGCILIEPTFASMRLDAVGRSDRGDAYHHRGPSPGMASALMASGGASKLAPLDTRSAMFGEGQGDDVYPDSELESPYSSDLLTPVSPTRRAHRSIAI
ncbi:hypothetical protein D9611_001403 [Ephemerocybe angulata]|uniref:Uncharacterized protein n=1 Tax=Ephemerocybe angulata TaxID=980116 RepID=A0A8H5CKR0_9AGAR|nr:hypothetical protein D9611_001403 [Tulosesus angulatus]